MNGYAKQNGIVLLVSLVLLLMLTVIAITAASQSNLQLRIASNSEQKNAAFQAAESGLQDWVNKYFSPNSSTDEIKTPVKIGPNEQYTVSLQSYLPCIGSGAGGTMTCFEILSTGETCDTAGDCKTSAIHRQGGQRREAQSQ